MQFCKRLYYNILLLELFLRVLLLYMSKHLSSLFEILTFPSEYVSIYRSILKMIYWPIYESGILTDICFFSKMIFWSIYAEIFHFSSDIWKFLFSKFMHISVEISATSGIYRSIYVIFQWFKLGAYIDTIYLIIRF